MHACIAVCPSAYVSAITICILVLNSISIDVHSHPFLFSLCRLLLHPHAHKWCLDTIQFLLPHFSPATLIFRSKSTFVKFLGKQKKKMDAPRSFMTLDRTLPRDHQARLQLEERLQRIQRSTLPSYKQFALFVQSSIQNVAELLQQWYLKQKELAGMARVLCGVQQCSERTLQSAVMFLVSVFYESIHINFDSDVTQSVQQQLIDMFGRNQIKRNLVKQGRELCKSVFDLVDVESLHDFFQLNAIRKSTDQANGADGQDDGLCISFIGSIL